MWYALVETKEAVRLGFSVKHHRVDKTGDRMVLNENELISVNGDIDKAAKTLHGEVMTAENVFNELNK